MKQLFSTLLIALTLLLSSDTSYAQDGANDPTFNSTDKGFDYGIGANNTVWKTAEQADGKIIIVGFFSSYNGFAVNGVARLNTNGSIDSTFNAGGVGAPAGVYSVALQPDGKLIIGGYFTTYNGITCNRLARLTTTGVLDTTFNVGLGLNNNPLELVVQPDGKIVAVGSFTANGLTSNRIARFNSNGTIDTTFNVGTGFNQDVYGVALQTDNKIVVAGFFSAYNGVGQNKVARLNSNGSIDTTFNIGTGPNNSFFDVAIQPDGKILLAGGQTAYNGAPCNYVHRINVNGSFDASFVTPNFNSQIRTIEILSSGKIAIGGDFTTTRMAMLNSDGSNDATFNIGTGFNNIILYIKARANGQIIITGSFISYNNNGVQKIACINANGTLDKNFNKGTGADGAVLASVILPNGKTIIAGSFTKYNGAYVNRIARLHVDGSIDTTFNIGTGANQDINAIALQPDGKIIIAGNFTTFNGSSKNYITRLNADGSLDASLGGVGTNTVISAVALQTDGKIIIGGNFTTYGGIARGRMARINIDGTNDATFNILAGANNTVYTIVIQPDGKVIIGGVFTAYRSISKSRIVRINTNGTVDATFNIGTGFNNSPRALAIQLDGKIIVGGNFTTYQGITKIGIVRLTTDGAVDTTFNMGTGLNSNPNAIALQGDGKIIIGGIFTVYNGTPVNNTVRINTNGTVDSTFRANVGAGPNAQVNTISLLNGGGNAIVGGFLTAYNTIGRNRVARIIGSSCPTPIISNIVAGSRCNAGTVTFTASTSAGALNWFSVSTDGVALGTGASFTTPSIATTTTYYVQAIDGACASARTAVVATVIIPTIASFLPLASGIGNSIIINGNDFTGATAVTIGGILSPSFTVISASQIRAVVPATTSGSIAVTTPCGIVTLAGFIFLTPPGNAFAFDGINDAVLIGAGINSNVDFTWEAWFKTGGDGTIMNKSASTWFTGGKTLAVSNGKIVFDAYNIGAMQTTSTNRYDDWNWHHVALTAQMNYSASSDNVMIYVDGELVAQRNNWDISSATEATLQNKIGGGPAGGYLNGTIDEVRIWNTVLTQAQIQTNKNNPISATTPNLVAYYSFDEGIPSGSNVGASTLYSQCSSLFDGAISGAALTGSTSNFVGSYAMVVPTALPATNYTGTSATAHWIAPITGNADAYELQVSNSPLFTSTFATINGIVALDYSIAGLTPDSTYYYRVRAINNSLNELGAYSNAIKICSTPTIVSTAGFTCNTGTVALKATASAGTLNWYTTATGGATIHTDTLFTTPTLTNTTTYYVDVTYNACTSARMAIVAAVKTASAASINASICNGNNYIFGTSTLTTSGTYTRTVPATNGCDSVITLNLIVKPNATATINASICNGNNYTFGTSTLTTSGTYTRTVPATNGCDSVITLNLIVKPNATATINASVCNGNMYTFGTSTLTASGTYTRTVPATNGCDSVITLNLVVKPNATATINAIICNGNSYTFGTSTLTTSGTYTRTVPATNGCDSVITLNLIVKPTSNSTINASACSFYTLNGTTYIASGTYTQTLTNSAGCDSILTLNLIINTITFATINASACSFYTLNGTTYTTSGTYNQTLTNSSGCDSVLTLNLIINPVTFATINASACSFYTLNGTTYTTSGTYTQTHTNSAGCDSVLTLNLTINSITFATINASACSFYTLNGTTYTTSGTYTQTLTNSAGCDSILTLNLTINSITFATINASACSFYTLNGTTYTTSGTYTQTLTNSAGCDSILTLNLIINSTITTTQNIILCAGQNTTVGTNIYTTSGTYIDTLTNSSGCDSIITTNLTVNPVLNTTSVAGDSITATVAGANYQWIDCITNTAIASATNQSYTATVTGSYAAVVTLNGCTDTSACVNIIITNLKATNAAAAVISAYPNPNNGSFTISTATYGTYAIINELGLTVSTFTTNANATTAHIAGLVSGMYVIKNTQNGTIARTKIVVTQ